MTGPSGMALLLGIAASGATLIGGTLALRYHRRLGVILGLAAGMVIGVALFDLLPEALALTGTRFADGSVLTMTGLALIAYMFVDRLAGGATSLSGRLRAHLAPASLTLHSFIDGTGIGLAFQLSPAAGVLVATAVIAHDLADGVNAVSLALATGDRASARRWLALNAAAPIAGVLAGSAVPVSAPILGMTLATFAGVFLYIGASQLLPRSHALRPAPSTSLASLAGALFMLVAVRLGH
ncbi:ZIP family metal transporter [Sphingomonas abietis]|uniref:ZIP family metal transporter n=1 Tax=Sphingomonas abietis TaxID=3012344 RepID=A0ABY7NKJ9_9SPHN|nr:ZIP family metal transporter [Sphingomonas abietis]WBO21031.1 ZIP family metal transporter [Sphingomonas abietis]